MQFLATSTPKISHEGQIHERRGRKLGGIMIEYEDENPAIRTLYEPECAGHGVQVNMRPS